MASTSETGHAKNLTNFDELISTVTGYGTAYNPSKAGIKLTALQTLSAGARNALNSVNNAMTTYVTAVAARDAAFETLSKLCTRVLNALKATDTTLQIDDSARSLVRKIQGKRATPKKTDEEKSQAEAEGKKIREVSSSHMGYDTRLENFDGFIKLLTSIPQYTPNEQDLKVSALTALCNDLKAKNAAVVAAATALSNVRIARNDLLYKPNTGLVDIALDIKTYVKSLYGATSPQYKHVSKLTFRACKG